MNDKIFIKMCQTKLHYKVHNTLFRKKILLPRRRKRGECNVGVYCLKKLWLQLSDE